MVLGMQTYLSTRESEAQRSSALGNQMWMDRLDDKIIKALRSLWAIYTHVDNWYVIFLDLFSSKTVVPHTILERTWRMSSWFKRQWIGLHTYSFMILLFYLYPWLVLDIEAARPENWLTIFPKITQLSFFLRKLRQMLNIYEMVFFRVFENYTWKWYFFVRFWQKSCTSPISLLFSNITWNTVFYGRAKIKFSI